MPRGGTDPHSSYRCSAFLRSSQSDTLSELVHVIRAGGLALLRHAVGIAVGLDSVWNRRRILLTAIHAVEAVAGSCNCPDVSSLIRAPADGVRCARSRRHSNSGWRCRIVHRIAGTGPGLGGQHAVRAGLIGLGLGVSERSNRHAIEAKAGSCSGSDVSSVIRAPADGVRCARSRRHSSSGSPCRRPPDCRNRSRAGSSARRLEHA